MIENYKTGEVAVEDNMRARSPEYCYYNGISKNGTDLCYTDRKLYENIDKVLQTPKLRSITIEFSYTTVEEDVFAKLSQHEGLEELELFFLHSNITTIPQSIFSMTSLKVLKITNIPIEELPEEIGNLNSLEALTVIQTNIETLPVSISKLTNLHTLEIEINNITDLPVSIEYMKELRSICLHNNNLKELPECISALEKLEEINIDWNRAALVTSNSVADLKAKRPNLNIIMMELNSQYYEEAVIYEEINDFYSTLDLESSTLQNGNTREVCEKLIKKQFGFENEKTYKLRVSALSRLINPFTAQDFMDSIKND